MTVENGDLLSKHNVQITGSPVIFSQLADQYRIPPSELRYMDLNRTGVYLPGNEVRVSFRARFIADLQTFGPKSTWFALPVRTMVDTGYSVQNNGLWFQDEKMGDTHEVELDTCDVSYQRGPNLLNLNSRSRSNCGGCTACVHNYKDLYDKTVIRDQERLVTQDQIGAFFDKKEQRQDWI